MEGEVVWEVWESTLSPATCVTCRGLHGKLFRRGEGPQPQLHDGCRCKRRYHHTEQGPTTVPPLVPAPTPPVEPAKPVPLLPLPLWPGDDDDDDDKD